jgi:hypothetical protein
MINQLILTLEAIDAVRGELAHHDSMGDSVAALEAHSRLMSLYASISIEPLVSELKQLTPDNVVYANFGTKRKAA